MPERAFTWAGVMGHLIGTENNSGRNGLATHAVVGGSWIRIFNVSVGTSVRARFYGDQPTGTSVSYSGTVEIPIPNVPIANGAVTGSVRSDFREAAIGGRLELNLQQMFQVGKALADRIRMLQMTAGLFDSISSFLPDIRLSGELAFYFGLSAQNVSYFRIQTAGGVSVKLPPGTPLPLRSASGGGGRSWQIQLRHWHAHIPRTWS